MSLEDLSGRPWMLGAAIEELGKAVSSFPRRQSISQAQNAHRYINEFLGDNSPSPTFNNEEAELSSAFHTWLRKYNDSTVSIILYRMIAENMAEAVWHTFIIELHNSKDIKLAINKAYEMSYDLETNAVIFHAALKIWQESGDIKNAYEFFLENYK